MDGTTAHGVAPAVEETGSLTAVASPSSLPTMSSSTANLTVSFQVAMAETDSVAPTESSSQIASLVSTPPTTARDSASVASEHEHAKPDHAADATTLTPARAARDQVVVAAPVPFSLSLAVSLPNPSSLPSAELATPIANSPITADHSASGTPSSSRRSGRARKSEPTYNLQKLAGTDIHGKRRIKGDLVSVRHMQKRLLKDEDQKLAEQIAEDRGYTIPTPVKKASSQTLVEKGINAAKKIAAAVKDKNSSSPADALEPRATRLSSTTANTSKAVATVMSKLGKRRRKTVEEETEPLPRELRRIQDTKEYYTKKDPNERVLLSYWSKGKLVDPNEVEEEAEQPARKKAKVQEAEEPADEDSDAEEDAPKARRRVKQYLDKGLFAGQEVADDPYVGLTMAERKDLAAMPEFDRPPPTEGYFKFPVYNGLRLLSTGRDFKLPFDVCNPLPPPIPRPAGWKLMTKNRYIGESRAMWKKTPFYKESTGSICDCTPEDGCGDSCHNRIMFYECNDKNCKIGAFHCTNRAFAELGERVAKGGRHRVGVDVQKTEDRGYGVRANRSFEPGQIIMEYAGEIITESECERRMNELYRDNECYYLMSYKGNMIIDATTGSMARFVNHSCSPNCHMTRWIVGGEPRMALFAGKERIEVGDELTYDYNFDPFSNKNVQKCLCGSANCRGVLGPRPKETKKRKADSEDEEEAAAGNATKKRKIATGKAVAAAKKKQLAKAKGAKAVFKKTVTTLINRKATKARRMLKKTTKTSVVMGWKNGLNRNGIKTIAAGGRDDNLDLNIDAYAAPSSPTPKSKAKAKPKATVSSKRGILSAKATKITKKVTAASKGKGKGKTTAPVSASAKAAIVALVDATSSSHGAGPVQVAASPTSDAPPSSSQAPRNGLEIPRATPKIRLVQPSLNKKP